MNDVRPLWNSAWQFDTLFQPFNSLRTKNFSRNCNWTPKLWNVDSGVLHTKTLTIDSKTFTKDRLPCMIYAAGVSGILEDFNSWWIVDYCRNPRFLSPAEFGALLAWFLPWSMLPAVQDVQLNFYSINSFSYKFLGFLFPTLLYDGSLFCQAKQKLSKLELQ